jgi:four helix bundle protein
MGKTAGEGFIPKHGGYRDLLSYRKALIVYQATMCFCTRFIERADKRTREQMIQAARSGKQNIIEGSAASGTSKEMEIKLMAVARASLEELLEDYEDFLRTHRHAIWDKNSKPALAVRRLSQRSKTLQAGHTSHGSHGSHVTYETYRPCIE